MGKEIYIERIISSLQNSIASMSEDMEQMSEDMRQNVEILTKMMNMEGATINVANITGSKFSTLCNKYLCTKSVDVYKDNATITFSGNTGVSVINAGGGNESRLYCHLYLPEAAHLTGTGVATNASFSWDVIIDNQAQPAHSGLTPVDFDYTIPAGWHMIAFRASGTGSGFGAAFTDLAIDGNDFFVPSDTYAVNNNVVKRSTTSEGKVVVSGWNNGLFNSITAAIWLSAFVNVNVSENVSFKFEIFDTLKGGLLLTSENQKNIDLESLLQINNFLFVLTAEYDPADPGDFQYGGFMMKYI